MSDSIQGPRPEPSEYSMPVDQLGFEMSLTEAYKATFMGDVLASSLDTLKRFAGIGIPLYKNPSSLSEDVKVEDVPADMTEDIGSGFVLFGSTNGPLGFETMYLQPAPKKLTQAEYDGLHQKDRNIYIACEQGLAVEGSDFPLHTKKMLKDIYSIIGAKKVRDDAANEPDGKLRGTKVYQGMYMDTQVYIVERWNTYTFITGNGAPSDSYTIRSVTIDGSESGKISVNQLSSTDVKKLAKVGLNVFEARGDGIDRTNIDSYIKNILEINGAMPGTGTFDQAVSIGKSTLAALHDANIAITGEDVVDRTKEVAGDAAEVAYGALIDMNKRRNRRSIRDRLSRKNPQ